MIYYTDRCLPISVIATQLSLLNDPGLGPVPCAMNTLHDHKQSLSSRCYDTIAFKFSKFSIITIAVFASKSILAYADVCRRHFLTSSTIQAWINRGALCFSCKYEMQCHVAEYYTNTLSTKSKLHLGLNFR